MRIIICILIYMMVCNRTFAQINTWRNFKNWKLYGISKSSQFSIPVDSLQYFKNIPLNDDSMKHFLSEVSLIPDERKPVWMGFYILSYQNEGGATRKIIAGQYGGFFYDEEKRQYYQLPLLIRRNWLNYLSENGALIGDQNK